MELDLARLVQIALELPLRADVPAEHDPIRRLVGEHPPPLAFSPVDPAIVDSTAGAGLEHRLGDIDAEHVVIPRLDLVELLSEDGKRALDRRLDDDMRPDGALCLRCH